MIQRTQFNNLTLNRIEEVFAHKFAGSIEGYLQDWRAEVQAGNLEGRSFYISINDKFAMDGILMQDTAKEEGTIFTQNQEVAQNLMTRARRTGNMKILHGDPDSIKWVDTVNLST